MPVQVHHPRTVEILRRTLIRGRGREEELGARQPADKPEQVRRLGFDVATFRFSEGPLDAARGNLDHKIGASCVEECKTVFAVIVCIHEPDCRVFCLAEGFQSPTRHSFVIERLRKKLPRGYRMTRASTTLYPLPF